MNNSVSEVSVAVTGLGWAGGGIRTIDGAMTDLVRSALSSIDITAYSMTGGASQVFDLIEDRLAANVTVRLVVNRLQHQVPPARLWLERLLDRFPDNFLLWDYPQPEASEMAGLHAKVVVVDRARALVGSANLSFLGLAASHELAVVIDGQAAITVARCVDRLVGSTYVRKISQPKDFPG